MGIPKVNVRVVMGTDGKTPTYDLMHEGYKMCEMSYLDVLQLAMQATSALRWYPRVEPKPASTHRS